MRFFTATPRDRHDAEQHAETTASTSSDDAVSLLHLSEEDDTRYNDVVVRLVEADDVGEARLRCVYSHYPVWCTESIDTAASL